MVGKGLDRKTGLRCARLDLGNYKLHINWMENSVILGGWEGTVIKDAGCQWKVVSGVERRLGGKGVLAGLGMDSF